MNQASACTPGAHGLIRTDTWEVEKHNDEDPGLRVKNSGWDISEVCIRGEWQRVGQGRFGKGGKWERVCRNVTLCVRA